LPEGNETCAPFASNRKWSPVSLAPDKWNLVCIYFQKRHVIAHKMGVVDEAYVKTSGDFKAVVGRKVVLNSAEIVRVLDLIAKLGSSLNEELKKLP
jgi:hypothetical protein